MLNPKKVWMTKQIENWTGWGGCTSVWATHLINMQQLDLEVRQPAPWQLLQSRCTQTIQGRTLEQGAQQNNLHRHYSKLFLHFSLPTTDNWGAFFKWGFQLKISLLEASINKQTLMPDFQKVSISAHTYFNEQGYLCYITDRIHLASSLYSCTIF